jgi:hypothetical protein
MIIGLGGSAAIRRSLHEYAPVWLWLWLWQREALSIKSTACLIK